MRHTGGGWYELEDGTRVRGKAAALAASGVTEKTPKPEVETLTPLQKSKRAKHDRASQIKDAPRCPHCGSVKISRYDAGFNCASCTKRFPVDLVA